MPEIADWLGTVTIDQEVKDACLAPGSNGVVVRIEYADGTSVETGLTTIEVNGTSCYMKCEDAPECYLELTNGAED